MKALVYDGPGRRSWTDVADPVVTDNRDAIVEVDATTICGTDLHILRGDVPTVEPGRVLGHEAVGTVVAVGPSVSTMAPGDRVLVSCITSCGSCRYCREGSYSQCLGGGGWILGHRIDGTQAEYVRVPFADTSVHRLPRNEGVPGGIADAAAVLLSDIFPTAFEVGVINGRVRPGDTVVIVGAGPIGLAAVITARLLSPSHIIVVDPAAPRRAAAEKLGATASAADADRAAHLVDEATGGLGADVTIEAVGIPETFQMCTRLVRPGGHVANVGVHGTPVTLHLEDLWIKNLTLTTGLVDTSSTPVLLRMVASGQLDVSDLVTHRFTLGEMAEAYDVFSRPADTGALKVLLHR